MDRGVPPRVTYWTGTWDPAQEAISKEVDLLRSCGGRVRPVVSLSSGQRWGLDWPSRAIRFSAREWWLMRAIAPAVERWGSVSHVFGSLDSWHLLRAVGRRPVVLTAALSGRPADRTIWSRVASFVAESEPVAAELRRHGVPAARIRLVYPGVDLHQYRPAPPPPQPFRVLFASSPSDPREFAARGIPLLVEAARACRDIEVVLLWRAWGDRAAAARALARLAPPPNLRVEAVGDRDMPSIYQSSHLVACLYQAGFGKSCPNSVVEALACGVPALVSTGVGIADLIADNGAGVAVPLEPGTVVAAIRAIRDRHPAFARAARRLAESVFDVRAFLAAYAEVYAAIDARPLARAA